jgi:hypothetical protein
MRNPLSAKPPGLKKAIRSKEPNVRRVNILINQEATANLEKVKTTLANFGPTLTNRKTGETGKPIPSMSLILARMLKVYLAYITHRFHKDGMKAMTEEFKAVTEHETYVAGTVKF